MMPAAGTAAAIATTAAVSSAAAATIYLQDEYDDDEESETTPMNMLEQDEDVEVEHANEPMADPVEPEGEVQYDADEEDNAYFSKTFTTSSPSVGLSYECKASTLTVYYTVLAVQD
jgi:hypothetical protein